MQITERQQKILDIVVRDYIRLVKPISSKYIEKKYNLNVSPATIRNDLKELVDRGYLIQPHTSAGRAPSDKGYRYFVNKLLNSKRQSLNDQLVDDVHSIKQKMENQLEFLRGLTKFLATLSSSLTYSYLPEEDLFWKEGFEETLLYPEFKNVKKIRSFIKLIKEFENNLVERLSEDLVENQLKIYIGKESPLGNSDFSILVSKYTISENKEGIIALLGPKRMPYDKNIILINSLVKLIENNHDERRK